MIILPLAAVAMTLLAGSSCAQPAPAPAASAESLLGRSMRPGERLAQYLDARRREFRVFDVDGDGAITDADLKLQLQIDEAAARATALQSLLQFDLDGDGVITRAEVEACLAGSLLNTLAAQNGGEVSMAGQFQSYVDKAMAPDANGDGRIDSAEMLAYGKKRAVRYNGNPLLGSALTLDKNRDGSLVLDEYLKAAEAAFHKADSDGDGVLSMEEIGAFRKQQMQMPNSAK